MRTIDNILKNLGLVLASELLKPIPDRLTRGPTKYRLEAKTPRI